MKKCLATVCDKNFLEGCKVMIKSFLDRNAWFDHDIVIIHDDLEPDDEEEIEELYDETKVFFVTPNVVKIEELKERNNFSGQMLKTYLKFEVFHVHRRFKYDRLVFIDSDCIILKSVKELFEMHQPFCACPERMINKRTGSQEFNTGVMVINRSGSNVSSSFFYDKYFEYNEFNHHGDQTIFNLYLPFPCHYIDSAFNTLKTDYRYNGSWIHNAKILHYVSKKPWEWAKPHHLAGNFEYPQIENIWWKYYIDNFDPKVLPSRKALLYLVRDWGLKTTAEVGVFKGDFSQSILDIVEPMYHSCIDPWENQSDYQDYANTLDLDKMYWDVKQRFEPYKNCTLMRVSGNIAAKTISGQLDFVYLDARHDMESVYDDVSVWWPKISIGGILAGHDYLDGVLNINGVDTVFGVKTAVDTFARENNLQVCYTLENQFRSWWINKR